MTMEEILEKWRLKEGNKKAGVELWDSMAQSFAEQALPDFTKNRFLRLLDAENMIDENFSVLDVGCGGALQPCPCQPMPKCGGVDFSPEMIRRAKDRRKRKPFTMCVSKCWTGTWRVSRNAVLKRISIL